MGFGTRRKESLLSLCDEICCGKLCNLFKQGRCVQAKAVRSSFRTTLRMALTTSFLSVDVRSLLS